MRRGCRRLAGRRLLPLSRAAARCMPSRASSIHTAADRRRDRFLPTYQALQRGRAQACRRSICATCSISSSPSSRRSRVDEVESITEIRKRFVAPGMSLGALGARGARDAGDRHEPHRRQVGLRRGRRGSGALQAARQRRQRQLGDQAGRLGALRRHRGISQQLPRARDQGRAGRQARRGRPAAGLQGRRR